MQPQQQQSSPVFCFIIEKEAHLLVRGDLCRAKYDLLKGAFREALGSAEVDQIIFQFDSPGGEVFGTDDLAETVYRGRGKKPILAWICGKCCSSAYWIASACDTVWATPASIIGSIGVMAEHVEIKSSGDKIFSVITSAPAKVYGMQGFPLEEEGKKEVQRQVDALHRVFVEAVTRYRGKAVPGDGRVYIGQEAREAGLVDEIGYMKREGETV